MTPLFAALAIAAACDLEHPSGARGCERAVIDRTVRMDQMQVVGTHNSYKRAIAPAEMALIRSANAHGADGLDYSHAPLTDELNAGARALEIDVVYDPQGGRFADPAAPRLLRQMGRSTEPYDAAPMRPPGLKVLHIQDYDYRTTCEPFIACLAEIAAWSRAHPDHVPILITMNLKEGNSKVPGGVNCLPFDAAAMDAVDAEIRSVFRPDEIITPDQVQGARANVRAAARAHAWPLLGAARGKVYFAMDEGDAKIAIYRGQRRSLEGRVLFVNAKEDSPASAYITLNEPLKEAARIRAALAAGLIVRTRADADTVEARANDVARRDAAFAIGAQIVSTDYLTPDTRFGPYQVTMPGGVVARLRPGVAPPQR